MLARYDAEIWDMDRAVGRLIGGLRERGRFDDTVIVFTADHGEEFTEHGYMEHAWTLYQETIHVPLVIRAGGAFPPAQLAERVSLVALMPTLLEVMEVGGKGLNFDREPVLVRKNGGIAYAPSRRPIRSELLQAHRSVVRSVIDGDWKYLGASRWLHPPQRDELLGAGSLQEDLDAAATDGHFWGPVVHEELYNLREDPGERNNLVRQREDVRRRLAGRVEDHIGRTRPGPGDSPERPRKKLSEEQLERLRSLGYLR
jgi:arylsulfatase A-like enzyme